MSQKKNNKRLLAVLTMALFSIVSFAQENADVNHTYEMRVDWIRVYQKEKHIPMSISVPMTRIQESTERNEIYSLQGAKVGTDAYELPKGIYVANGRKFVK